MIEPNRDEDERPGFNGRVEMVAIDIDGTLLRTDKRLSIHVVDTIRKVSRRGVKVVLASARPPRSMREIYSLLKLDTLEINYNGALIHNPVTRQRIMHQPITPPLGQQLVDLARALDPTVIVSVELLDKWYTDRLDEQLPTETSRTFKPDYIGPLQDILAQEITKLMLLSPPTRLAPVRETIAREFRGRIGMATSDAHLVQLIHPNVDKAQAVQQVAAHYGIDQHCVMAIGDAPNDAGMLRWAGLSVAVSNAWPEARAAADYLCASNDEDGVAEALQHWVLETH